MASVPGDNGTRPAKRVRSETQMAKKRQADRLKHRGNRAETKTRLENMERDISNLRTDVKEILSLLGSATPGSPAGLHRPPASCGGDDATAMVGALPGAGELHYELSLGKVRVDPTIPISFSGPARHSHPPTWPPQRGRLANAAGSPWSFPSLPAIECRCGVSHFSPSDCLELGSFTTLYQAHLALSQDPELTIHIPRNPLLANLMLHPIGDNPLNMALATAMRNFEVQTTETLFGLYFLIYRLLRWRLFPTQESYCDVPELIRPTEVQDSILHPVSIDFIPWSRLRDYLCLNQNKDQRHSVNLYARSIRLEWPTSEKIIQKGLRNVVELHPRFEAIVCDIRNWKLDSPWAEQFPHLAQYV